MPVHSLWSALLIIGQFTSCNWTYSFEFHYLNSNSIDSFNWPRMYNASQCIKLDAFDMHSAHTCLWKKNKQNKQSQFLWSNTELWRKYSMYFRIQEHLSMLTSNGKLITTAIWQIPFRNNRLNLHRMLCGQFSFHSFCPIYFHGQRVQRKIVNTQPLVI